MCTTLALDVLKPVAEKRKLRRYLKVRIGNETVEALYDTGADFSCMSEEQYKKIPKGKRPMKLYEPRLTTCLDASGNQMRNKGTYEFHLVVEGKVIVHPVKILSGLKEKMILGMDFIQRHRLIFDPRS